MYNEKNKFDYHIGSNVYFFSAGFVLKNQEFASFDFFQEIKNLRAAVVSDYGFFSKNEKLLIAACPTFYYMLEKLKNNEGMDVIRTQSTAEGLGLLKQGRVDLLISGRALKPEEPNFLFEKIGPGYGFIFEKEIFILENEMDAMSFFTDIDVDKIIQDFIFISKRNITKVENPYNYLNKGIAIVDWGARMDKEGKIVYIFKDDGSRVRLSRLPRLYYSSEFEQEKLSFVKEIIKEN